VVSPNEEDQSADKGEVAALLAAVQDLRRHIDHRLGPE
jgi:hypothetical protein